MGQIPETLALTNDSFLRDKTLGRDKGRHPRRASSRKSFGLFLPETLRPRVFRAAFFLFFAPVSNHNKASNPSVSCAGLKGFIRAGRLACSAGSMLRS